MNKDDISAVGAARRLSQPKKRPRQATKPRAEEKKTTMKAAAIDKFGPSLVLILQMLPTPKPGPGEVPIAAIYPLAQAAKAHQRLEKGHVLGRIVIEIK